MTGPGLLWGEEVLAAPGSGGVVDRKGHLERGGHFHHHPRAV